LSKPVSVPTSNTVGAENCGTFVAKVLQANGIKGIDTQKLYSVFKGPQGQVRAPAHLPDHTFNHKQGYHSGPTPPQIKPMQIAPSMIKEQGVAESREITKLHKLDSVLEKCIEMIRRGHESDPERYGRVAACLIDNKNNHTYAINMPGPGHTRRHAERMAIDKHLQRHGRIGPNAIMITTLSPCVNHMDERYGESCTDLLSDYGIEKCYAGWQDPTQHPAEDYPFNLQVTDNADIFNTCRDIAASFLPQTVAEGTDQITWIKPNFDYEWHEVEEQSRMEQVPVDVRQYYQKHFPNKDAWIQAVQHGRAVVVPPDHTYEIRNSPPDKASLQKVLAPTGHEGPIGPAKKKRVDALFAKGGPIEMPIVLKTSKGLWLIGGKTRLGTANYIKGIPAKVWVIGGKKDVDEAYTGPPMKFLRPGELSGGYSPQQMQAMGFKQTANGSWYIPMNMWQRLVSGGQIKENFADGRHPEDKGDSKRHGVPTKSSVSNLRKFAKSHSGRAAQLAHWMANMKSGRAKKKKTNEDSEFVDTISPGFVADWDDQAGQIRYTKNNIVIPYGTPEYNAARAQHVEYRKNLKYNKLKQTTDPIYDQIRGAFEKEQQSPTKPGAAIAVPQELFPQDKIKPPIKYDDPTDDDFVAEDYDTVTEAFVGSIFLPNVELSVNTHAYDQADLRRVNYELVDQVAKKADSVASELSKIGPNEEVYVYDPETRVSLGLRRIFGNKMKFQFNTVLGNRPYPDGRTKIIDIPSDAPAARSTNSFVNLGQNTVRKITQAPTTPTATRVVNRGPANVPDHLPGEHDARLPYQQEIPKPAIRQIVPNLIR